MKLLKNKEVRGALLWQLSVSVIACSLCFLFDLRAGLTAVVLSLLLMLIYCIGTYKRYRRIASLADDINHVLHGDSPIDFDNYSEGELSILHSEIYKMTVRLREQQQKLLSDKEYLADSFPFFSVVFFFGRHSHIHPAFHKNLFCGARLCSARESSPSFPALRSFSCTPDSVPTLLLTVYRIGVCALLAVSSFESAWSTPFSYGTIPRIAVPAKSAAAYPVGRVFGCV